MNRRRGSVTRCLLRRELAGDDVGGHCPPCARRPRSWPSRLPSHDWSVEPLASVPVGVGPAGAMALTFSEQETAFRDELRSCLAENAPGPKPTEGGEDAEQAWRRDWQRRLYEAGWAAPHWPVEYGGRGATPSESAIYFEEIGRARVPMAANILGLLLGGPTLMAWGTPEQKERYLEPILSAEEIWCQGFSEPDAGSDLASLKTRAVKRGE